MEHIIVRVCVVEHAARYTWHLEADTQAQEQNVPKQYPLSCSFYHHCPLTGRLVEEYTRTDRLVKAVFVRLGEGGIGKC